MYNQNYLCHYGVQGMRWGRRKIQKMTKEVNDYHNRTLSDAASMRDRANVNLSSAIKTKVDKKTLNGIKDAHDAWVKSYEAIKNMKVPSLITSPEEYRRAKDTIDRVAAQSLIDFEKKYGTDQAFELAWS